MKLRGKIILSIFLVGSLILSSGLLITAVIGMIELRSEIGGHFKGLAQEAAHKTDLEFSNEILRLNNLVPLIQDELQRVNGLPAEISAEADWARERRNEAVERPLLKNRISTLLRKQMEVGTAQGKYFTAFITDGRGALVGSINPHPEYFHGDQGWWKRTHDSDLLLPLISEVYLLDQEYVFDIVIPIIDQATVEVIGVMKVVVNLKRFLERPIHQIRFGKTGHAMLIDSDGTVLICPILPTGSHVADPSLIQKVASGQSGWVRADDDGHGGKGSIVGFAPISELNTVLRLDGGENTWHAFIRQDPAESYRPVQSLLFLTSVAGAILIGLTTLAATILSDKLVKPIRLLQEGAKRIGKGDFGHRLAIPPKDEIGELAAEFNRMAGHLHESNTLLEQKVVERTKDLNLLHQVALVANRSLDLTAILKDTLSLVVDRMNADAGYIGVIDAMGSGEERVFANEAWLGAPEEVIADWKARERKPSPPPRPFVADPSTLSAAESPCPFLAPDYKTVVIVPIAGGDAPFGILCLARRTAFSFPPDAADLLWSATQPVGIAIQNAKLFQKVQELDRLKSELISNVSHEIRTPLTSILGYAELLEEDCLDSQFTKQFVSIIHQEGNRLIHLLNDLLDLSKLADGKTEWTIRPIDLRAVLTYATDLATPLANRRGLTLRMEATAELPPVQGDEHPLYQVLSNLLSNAIKFMPSGEVVIGAEKEGNYVKVFVKDRGIGIPPEEQKRIFEKFYQVTSGQTGKPKGTGLGLAICREIITRLGGKIWCESKPGEGSTFFFTLKVSEDPPKVGHDGPPRRLDAS